MSHTTSAPPRYPYPILQLIPSMLRVLCGAPSSISHDAAIFIKNIRPTPRVLGTENIPRETPFVLVLNHYDHPGLGAWWGPLVALRIIAMERTREPRELRPVMAREWWYPPGLGRVIKQPLTHWFFGQMAKTYGLILLPPIIGNHELRGQGMLGVRQALALTRGDHPQLIGVAPEGRTGMNQALCLPPPGTGLFLLMLTHDAIPCLPLGIYEDENSALTVKFGAPFLLHVPRQLEREERDQQAMRMVMAEIGKLLPERMWGAYREEIVHQNLEGF